MSTKRIVDTQDQELQVRVPGRKQRRHTIEEHRGIVEGMLVPSASVSRVASARCECEPSVLLTEAVSGMTTGGSRSTPLLPVKVCNEWTRESRGGDGLPVRLGTMEIKLPKGTLRVSGAVDVVELRGAGVPIRMIGPPAGTRIWIAGGSDGSAAWIYRLEWHGADRLQENPLRDMCSFVFHGPRGDLPVPHGSYYDNPV